MAINDGSVLHLKQMLRGMIRKLEASTAHDDAERCEKFRVILRNIPSLQGSLSGRSPAQPHRNRFHQPLRQSPRHGTRHSRKPPAQRTQAAGSKQARPPDHAAVKLKLVFRDVYREPCKRTWFNRWIGRFMRRRWDFRSSACTDNGSGAPSPQIFISNPKATSLPWAASAAIRTTACAPPGLRLRAPGPAG